MSTLTDQELRATLYFAVGVTSESRGHQRSHALPLPSARPAPAHALHCRRRSLSRQATPHRQPLRPGPAPKRPVAGTARLCHCQQGADPVSAGELVVSVVEAEPKDACGLD